MADRGHHTAATDNEAVVIGAMYGHRVPDRYATGQDPEGECDAHGKMGDAHYKLIHNDYAGHYGTDSAVNDPFGNC